MSRISAKVIFCGLADMAQRHTASMQHRQCWSGVAYFGRPRLNDISRNIHARMV
jgi:hypothetical protein